MPVKTKRKLDPVASRKHLKLNRNRRTNSTPIKSFKIFLFPDLEKYFHWITIVLYFCEPREILFNLIPFTCQNLVLKILDVEVETRFLFQSSIKENNNQAIHIVKNRKINGKKKTYRCTVPLNFSSSKNCKIRNTSSRLKEDMAPPSSDCSSANYQIQTQTSWWPNKEAKNDLSSNILRFPPSFLQPFLQVDIKQCYKWQQPR